MTLDRFSFITENHRETSFYSEAFSILPGGTPIFTTVKPLYNLKVSITNPKGEAYLKSKFQVDSAV